MRARLSALAVTLTLVCTASADAATLSVTTTGSDTAACTPAAPCKSFNAAYKKASAGDVVEVAAGSYAGQSIQARTLTGTPVTIKAAAGAAVTLSGSLDINTNNIVVQGFKASDLNVDSGGSTVLSDVTTIDIDAVTAYFQNTRNLVVKGGRLGGKNNKTPVYVGAWPMSYNVTFDGVVFHDATVTDSTVHTECLMVNDVQGMVIRNSTFTNCGYFGLMISHLMGELPPRDVTLENNVFETTYQWNGQPAPYSMLIGPIDGNDFVFRNNTFVTEPTFNGTTWSNGSKFVGNLGVLGTCQSGAAYSRNVWTGVTCGSTDKRSSTLASGYVDAAAHDWRLKPTAIAIDAGSTTDFPATDHDGNARPSGGAPDAGAFEAGASTPPADTTAPETTISSAPASSTSATTASFSFTASESGSTFQCRIDGGSWASCSSPKAYTGFALGSHTFSVRATDAAGNTDASPDSVSWTVVTPPDTTAPETTISSSPAASTTATSASLAFSASESGSTFECRIDGGSWVTCTSPKAYSGLALGAHSFDVRATDAAGNTDASPASASWTVVTPPDTTAPETTISSSPASSTTSTSAALAFTASESGSTFECRIDGGAWTSCSSPKAYSGLALGSHTFSVRATDAAGNVDASPDSFTWTVVTPPDTTAPNTTITSSPSSSTTSTSATLAFTASESGSTFECRIDGGAWTSCSSPKAYSNLALGSHTVEVRATDAAGNTDASPDSFTWTVVTPPDTTAPDTTITSSPASSTTSTSASLAFTASESGSTFECRIDGGAWTSCTSPKAYANLALGSHTVEVRATDAAGNTDASPDSFTWTVVTPPDTTAPDTTITSSPASSTTSMAASLTFSSSESGSTFQCRIDGGAWVTCTSPKAYTNLALGTHTVEVRAIDAAGNVDGSPASVTWTVVTPPDTTAPDTTISLGPDATTELTDARFTFTATEAGTTFQCRIDAEAWATCTGPVSLTGLAVGDHVFAVRAIDAAGNIDGSPATFRWTISAPVVVPDPDPADPVDPVTPVEDPAPADPVVVTPPAADPLPPVDLPAPPAPTLPNAPGTKTKKAPKIGKASLNVTTVCRVGTSRCPSRATLTVQSTDAKELSVTVARRGGGSARASAAAAARIARSLKVGSRSGGKSTTTLSAKGLTPGTYTVTIVAQNGTARSSSCVLILTVR